jgi:hypothetical protein
MRVASRKDGVHFEVRADGVDLRGIDRNKPVTISLQIGKDLGVTAAPIER